VRGDIHDTACHGNEGVTDIRIELLQKVRVTGVLADRSSTGLRWNVPGRGRAAVCVKTAGDDRTFLFFTILFFALFLIAASSYAQQADETYKGQTECVPTYGNYVPSERWGWYGARREVKTPLEALEILQKIIVIHHTGIRVGKIREGVRFYMAEIVNTKGQIVDVIVIDRQSGRIRSAY
jgi:hypothetical protein